jgi:16S rRNA C967 or C1407 C5-methylase (RsmB/RsmF family)/NOL1/NOP2/fmu family ribosome biogenesis protein
MLPEEFLERIRNQPYIDSTGLADALDRPSETSVRVNRHKWPYPVTGYEKVSWEPDGYYLPGKTLFTPDPLFHAGVYYPQESSGMFTGELFRQLTAGMTGLRVLDLCGAPGGKSTHLSALLGDDGLLVANEVIRARSAVLAENITKWGMGNTVVTQNDPARFASLPGFFDVMVADAPCSGEGMFRSPAAVKEWSPSNGRLCSERQRRIVMEAWPALRPGGILIYSTCTFNPAENEENISWITETTGSERLNADLSGTSGVTVINHAGIQGYGFHPDRIRGEGFFIAAVRKPDMPAASPRYDRKGVLRPSAAAFSRAEPLADFDRGRMIMAGNRIMALATDTDLLSHLSDRLTVIKSGTMIGELKNDNLVPAHDLAMSVRQKRGSWPEYGMSYDEAVSFLRLEIQPAASMPRGRVLVNYRGVPLGFVNNLGNRLNNGYPQSWRIRMEKQPGFKEIL